MRQKNKTLEFVSKIHWRPIGKIRQINFIQIGRTGDRWLTDDEKKGVVSRSASCLTVLLPAHALPALMQPILITTTSQSTPARARSRSIFTRQNARSLPVLIHSLNYFEKNLIQLDFFLKWIPWLVNWRRIESGISPWAEHRKLLIKLSLRSLIESNVQMNAIHRPIDSISHAHRRFEWTVCSL